MYGAARYRQRREVATGKMSQEIQVECNRPTNGNIIFWVVPLYLRNET
jgi:aspartate/methionine/tyrosine aminotransferase